MHLRLNILFFIIIFLFQCNSENKINRYLNNIPQEESINASIYNYEIILAKMAKRFNQKDYYGVIFEYEKYLKIFEESEISIGNEMNYWVGMSIKRLVDDEDFLNFILTKKIRKKWYGIEFEEKYYSNTKKLIKPKKITYNRQQFLAIIKDRSNEKIEKKAMQEIYLSFFTNVKEKADNQNNFNYLYKIIARYPELFSKLQCQKLISQKINVDWLSKTNQEKLAKLYKILDIQIQAESSIDKDKFNRWFLSINNEVVVFNRSSWITSRNLTSIKLWEPFNIINQVEGEDGNTWYYVLYHNQQKGFIDAQSRDNLMEINPSKKKPMLSSGKNFPLYIKAYQAYLKKDYLSGIEYLSTFLIQIKKSDDQKFFLERAFYFQSLLLHEIAIRSTSINNIYTDFALEHPSYFEVSDNEINLLNTDFFLKKIILLNPNSSMLQYFDGFN